MKKYLDCTNQPCPKPMIQTKKMVDSGVAEIIVVTVDNVAARENITKYAAHANVEIVSVIENGDDIVITLNSGGGSVEDYNLEKEPLEETTAFDDDEISGRNAKVIFISKDTIGTANRELGLLLLRGFIFTLTELEKKPEALVFMNDGVRLAIEGSDSIKDLNNLREYGVDIVVCGTCLDYLKITDKLKVGRISNMYDITDILMNSDSVVTV